MSVCVIILLYKPSGKLCDEKLKDKLNIKLFYTQIIYSKLCVLITKTTVLLSTYALSKARRKLSHLF